MSKICCDICGGQIEVQSGGKGLCLTCGTAYSVASLREKYQGSAAGNDGFNYDSLLTSLKLYLEMCDWVSAENICKKILEKRPADSYIIETYRSLQDWKHFEVTNGILKAYHGRSKIVKIPYGVTQIDYRAFSTLVGKHYEHMYIDELHVPGSVKEFNTNIALHVSNRIVFEEGVESICGRCYEFGNHYSPAVIELPKSLIRIDNLSFWNRKTYADSPDLYVPIDLTYYKFPNGMNEKLQADMYKIDCKCQHCGGEIKHRFIGKASCVKCGHVLDYNQSS